MFLKFWRKKRKHYDITDVEYQKSVLHGGRRLACFTCKDKDNVMQRVSVMQLCGRFYFVVQENKKIVEFFEI